MNTAGIRIDKWLWAARFFKTRGLASEAVKGGHVWLNGTRAKASKLVHIGNELNIQKVSLTFIVIVKALADKRGSATLAQALYEETPDSIKQRTELAEQRRLGAAYSPAPDKRPDKRDRRNIIRFKSK